MYECVNGGFLPSLTSLSPLNIHIEPRYLSASLHLPLLQQRLHGNSYLTFIIQLVKEMWKAGHILLSRLDYNEVKRQREEVS